MKTISYKTAKDGELTKDHLPDDYITEWTSTEPSPEGWHTINEDKFKDLLAISNSDDNIVAWKAAKDIARNEAMLAVVHGPAPIDPDADEYQAFKAWKASQNG